MRLRLVGIIGGSCQGGLEHDMCSLSKTLGKRALGEKALPSPFGRIYNCRGQERLALRWGVTYVLMMGLLVQHSALGIEGVLGFHSIC
jgi:hypothetical protein